jgi:hypothetical protein
LLVATGRRGIYGVDTHSGLHHREREPGVTSAQRAPCRRKSHIEGQAERATLGEIGFQLVPLVPLVPLACFPQIEEMIRRELSTEVIL